MERYYALYYLLSLFCFFSSRRRHTRYWRDWSSDVCSSDVRDAGFEPADHPGAPAGEQDARLPGFAEDLVEAVHAPDREHVRGVPSRDDHDVVRERELTHVLRRPRVEGQRRQLRAPAEPLVPGHGPRRILVRGRRH